MRFSVVLTWVGGLLFVAGGILSLTGAPLWLAFLAMVAGAGVVATMLFRSPWRPTQGHDPAAQQAEARLWSTLNNNRR